VNEFLDRSGPVLSVRLLDGADEPVDLSGRVLSLSYEDAEKEADKLTLVVDNFDLSNFDAPVFKQGNRLEVSWGYAGNMSPPREVIIQKVKGFQKLQVEGLSKAILMNKLARTRVFVDSKRSEIAATIAEENGYGPEIQFIEDTEEILPVVAQARMTDAQLLRQMAQREGFEFFVDYDGFHFHRRHLGQKPIRGFVWYVDRVGEILSIDVENDVYAKPGAVTAKGRDPLAKEDIEERADNGSLPERDTLSSVIEIIDKRTGEASTVERAKSNASETTFPTTEPTKGAAARQAEGVFVKAQQLTVQLTFTAIGDPSLVAKSLILISGIGQTLSGRYYVSSVKHDVGKGYTMTVKTRRDGKSAPATGSGSATDEGTPSKGKENEQEAPPPGEMSAVEVVDQRTGETRTEYRDARGRTSPR
jgi:phage protein D